MRGKILVCTTIVATLLISTLFTQAIFKGGFEMPSFPNPAKIKKELDKARANLKESNVELKKTNDALLKSLNELKESFDSKKAIKLLDAISSAQHNAIQYLQNTASPLREYTTAIYNGLKRSLDHMNETQNMLQEVAEILKEQNNTNSQ